MGIRAVRAKIFKTNLIMNQAIIDKFGLVDSKEYIGRQFIYNLKIYHYPKIPFIYFMECDAGGEPLKEGTVLIYHSKAIRASFLTTEKFLLESPNHAIDFYIENELIKC